MQLNPSGLYARIAALAAFGRLSFGEVSQTQAKVYSL
jgi:hypothetical protein